MSEPVVLYNSGEVHKEIKRLFGQPAANDRRVALVAYVGSDGEAYLPHPSGLRVICSPSPGGTDPDTIRRLVKKGAWVQFSTNLHMKVYWSKLRGCVVASANASSSALGANGLKETGVRMPSANVDIDRLIQYAAPRRLDAKELRKLDKSKSASPRGGRRTRTKRAPAADFLGWYESIHRPSWKFGWVDEEQHGAASSAKEQAKTEYGIKEPHDWIAVGKGRIRKNDWVLAFSLTDRGAKGAKWLFVDFVVKVQPSDKKFFNKTWPLHAVQVHSPAKCPLPPFRITSVFRRALSRAILRDTRGKLEKAKSDVPPARVLKSIAEEMN